MHKLKTYRRDIIIIVIISIIASIGILKDFNQTTLADDVFFHIARFRNFFPTILDNHSLPFVDPAINLGLSFSFNLFYGILSPLIANIVYLPFQNWPMATNALLYLCILTSGFTMYYVVKKITDKRRPALIASILYMVSPYFILDFYIRYAIGEIFAFTVAPILILGIYQFINNQPHAIRNISFSAIFLVLSHNLSAFLFATTTLLLLLFNIKKIWQPQNLKKILIIIGIIIGITAFYTLPLLEASSSTKYFMLDPEMTDVYSHMSGDALNNERTSIIQLFHLNSYDSIALGKYTISAFLICIFMLPYLFVRKKIKDNRTFLDQLLIISVLFILGTSVLIDWNLTPHFLRQIQFPWRFLEITTVLYPIICGVCYSEILNLKPYSKYILYPSTFIYLICVIFFQLIMTIKSFNYYSDDIVLIDYIPSVAFYQDGEPISVPTINYWINDNTTYETVTNLANQYGGHITSDATISGYRQSGTTISFNAINNSNESVQAIAPLFFYPGYQAKSSSGQNLPITINDRGLVSIEIPANFSEDITLNRAMTLVQIIGIAISGATIIILVIIRFHPYQKSKIVLK